ncbi:hypothetical protein GA0115260_109322 [Streptomyces sp. MnatMP-M27]|nr:hypothetical protein GA0115260_109322 [Streptomyces sp. MnatMP-M27]
MRPKSGVSTTFSGTVGTVSPHWASGIRARELIRMATTVMVTMPIRIAPRVLRTIRMNVSARPTTNTSTGQPWSRPATPRPRGTVVCAESGLRLTKPESTRPIRAMKSPMPIAIARRNPDGIASITRCRSPEATRIISTRPASTTMPIASGQLILGASWSETTALMPRPAASAMGTLPMIPMSSVVRPAIRAVAVTS